MTTKSEIIRTVAIVWFLAATGYVAYDLWNDYKIKGIQNAYNSGVQNTVNELIRQVESSQCQPVDVFSGEKKMQLIDFGCLQQQAPEDEKKQ